MPATLRISSTTHQPSMARAAGLLLLAMALAFLAGRATVVPARASPPAAQAPAAILPAEPPPWSTQGFRDDETSAETCSRPECEG